jgi:nucleotidyltransferase substrate binding protein (TIGR01987 family)
MKLDTTSLGNAVRRLREGLARCEREPADEQVRDGLIQRFEFTYELCHKMLRRYLKQAAASPDEIEQMPFADLIRAGNAQGVLWADWSAWRRFREVRARTSHNIRCQGRLAGRRCDPDVSRRSRGLLCRTAAAARMTRRLHIDLSADQRRLVLNILHAHLSSSTKAWVFGSRATGRARRYSDLDLAIDAGRKLTLDEIARLVEAFSDSDLPYRVEFVDWHDMDDHWRQTIVAERIVLTEAAS